jgi:hypothetical protein
MERVTVKNTVMTERSLIIDSLFNLMNFIDQSH